MFAVRVCPIPVLNPNIVKDKIVKSSEEAGDEINHVLTRLRDSGQLMKHIKPKEFMESALSKIKLGEIAAFDMNTNFKPVYKSLKDKEEEEKKKSEDNATVNRAHQ